ncbi:MAG: PEP-CTERM sorting domain-containing protein [Pseudomonadota bacterium]
MTTLLRSAIAAAALAALSTGACAATNVLPGNWDVIQTTGVVGVLRAGSPWTGSASLAAQSSIVNGVFVPEGQTWNTGSWWWDEDPSVNAAPLVTTIHLTQLYTIDSFSVQADDNDSYRLEYWDGAAWQLAWDIPTQPSFGLVTRNSGLLSTSITTDFLRFTATGGDNYYAVSEIQAFGVAAVPEPSTYALMLGGLGMMGYLARRRRS